MSMHVLKRDGRRESVHFDKITSRISKLAFGLDSKVCHSNAFFHFHPLCIPLLHYYFLNQKVIEGGLRGWTGLTWCWDDGRGHNIVFFHSYGSNCNVLLCRCYCCPILFGTVSRPCLTHPLLHCTRASLSLSTYLPTLNSMSSLLSFPKKSFKVSILVSRLPNSMSKCM